MRRLLPAVVLTLFSGAAQAADPVLTVYTYDSFVSEWGPGPSIEQAFESECVCDIRFVSAGDGAAVLSRLQLEGSRSEADVVLGLDTTLMTRARKTGLLAPHGIAVPELDLPIAWSEDDFVPFDWGHFAFVYDTERLAEPPTSFRDLIASDLDILIQDPRSSTPGLGLLMWVKAAYGENAPGIWSGLEPRIVTVTQGWSEAYGLFLDGEADMVLSYTTSPAYHMIAEDDPTKAAAKFEEGHYLQVEVAAKLASSDESELASEFLQFLLSDPAQSIIPTTNWMYPANMPQEGLPDAFSRLVDPAETLHIPSDEVQEVKDEALDEWLSALSG